MPPVCGINRVRHTEPAVGLIPVLPSSEVPSSWTSSSRRFVHHRFTHECCVPTPRCLPSRRNVEAMSLCRCKAPSSFFVLLYFCVGVEKYLVDTHDSARNLVWCALKDDS